MNEHSFDLGDRVVINPQFARPAYVGNIYTVVERRRVRVVIERKDGGGGRTAINPQYLLPAPDPAAPAARVTITELTPPLHPGTLVTSAHPERAGRTFVVLRESTGDRYSIVVLGGSGQYWRGVSRADLTVVDVSRVRIDPPGPSAQT